MEDVVIVRRTEEPIHGMALTKKKIDTSYLCGFFVACPEVFAWSRQIDRFRGPVKRRAVQQ